MNSGVSRNIILVLSTPLTEFSNEYFCIPQINLDYVFLLILLTVLLEVLLPYDPVWIFVSQWVGLVDLLVGWLIAGCLVGWLVGRSVCHNFLSEKSYTSILLSENLLNEWISCMLSEYVCLSISNHVTKAKWRQRCKEWGKVRIINATQLFTFSMRIKAYFTLIIIIPTS